MKFTIDKNVPIPPRQQPGLPNDLRETMKDMKPGDSFVVLINKTRPVNTIQTALATVRKQVAPRRFTAKKYLVSPGVFGLRIWEVEPAKPK